MKRFLARIRSEITFVGAAVKDKRTPWHAKALGVFLVGYVLCPINCIPNFIPVLGWIDDLIVLPLGLWLFYRLLPHDVMIESRQLAGKQPAP